MKWLASGAYQLVFSLFQLYSPSAEQRLNSEGQGHRETSPPTSVSPAISTSTSTPTPTPSKAIAIVGGGTAGLGALKALLDLPWETRRDWRIDLYEQRHGLGGVWLPDPDPPAPPELPESPLYPELHTNTPHPTMTYPGLMFPPGTALYPSHVPVQAYHADFAARFNLTPHIHLSQRVVAASYAANRPANGSAGKWTVTVLDTSEPAGKPANHTYDHLLVANGHNRYPYEPSWEGRDDWINGGESADTREFVHSLWYREPERYEGKTVIVVGNGASGRDIASQVVPFAKAVYHSYSNSSVVPGRKGAYPPIKGTITKPRISHFDYSAIHFSDGTWISPSGPTSVVLGTGYDLLVPFLADLQVCDEPSRFARMTNATLATNRRYIRPLFRQIFPLEPSGLPATALAFVGLPVWIANAPSDYAQGLAVAHALAYGAKAEGRGGTAEEAGVLGMTKEEMWKELLDEEEILRKHSIDPFRNGHRFAFEGADAGYQDSLIDLIRARSSLPLPAYLSSNASRPYVEPWRRWGRASAVLLKRGWERAVDKGIARRFLKDGGRGGGDDEGWAGVMSQLAKWEEEEEAKERRVES